MTSALHTVFSDPFSIAAVLMLFVLAVAVLFPRSRKPWLARIQRKALLTPNETEFFHRLQRALPRYYVFPQVAFAALLTDDGLLSSRERWAVRSRFERKSSDFVICERRTLKEVALAELDDRSYVALADRQSRRGACSA